MIVRTLAAPACLALTACTSKIYDDAKPGEFEGTILVMWVGPGDGGGDGKFVYVPDLSVGGKALKFQRGEQKDPPKVNVEIIEPHFLYTDGGSIPRFAQPVKGLNPWGYAPAYMVHDWLFLAHRCNDAEDANDWEEKVKGVTFEESYRIMAEMLKTLEESGRIPEEDLRKSAITWAVSSRISRAKWDSKDCPPEPRISEEHYKEILARLQIGPEGQQKSVVINGESVAPAEVWQVVRF